MLKIYTDENNPAALKLIIAAQYANQPIKIELVNLNDKSLAEPRHLPYLKVDGDSNVIFLPNSALWYILAAPDSHQQVKEVNAWLEYESAVLSPHVAAIVGTASKNDKVKYNNYIVSCLKKLNEHLEKNQFIGGESAISAADIAIWCTLYPLFIKDNLAKEYLNDYTNIVAWIKYLQDQTQFKDALGKFKIKPDSVCLSGAKYLSSVLPSNSTILSPQHNQSDVVSDEEIDAAKEAWLRKISANSTPTKTTTKDKIVLPRAGEKNILITSALPYVNNVPHLGNIIGCVLSADVFARFSRLSNDCNTLFVCGTDEYGTATETKALEEGLTCQQICDKYYRIHADIYQWFNISFDHFGRTSTGHQTELCQAMFARLNDNGFIFIQAVEQLHCKKCDRFLADRFVEGICPHIGCNYEDARGDQCDGCGKLVNANELKNPRCKICGNKPELATSKQFFMDLPKLEPLLLHWMKQSSTGWSNNAQEIGKAWLKEGLKARCITRDLKWGVSVPLEGYRDKVFYVWFDAPIGYMSITKSYTEHWEQWWKPKNDVKITLYQFMAKDNVPFHSVMFPAALLGANNGYTTVSHIMATEYLNYEDGKFSKSRGVGVFGNDARNTGIPSDVWRFYLLYVRPESQDSSFSWLDLATKNNSELLNNLGNFINRALMFAKNSFNKTVPEMQLIRDDFILLAQCTREYRGYISCVEKAKLRDGIRHILSISRHGNQYMQSNQPWVLLKGNPNEKIRAGTVIGICCNLACLLATLLHPYMPETSLNLLKQLNIPEIVRIPEKSIEISNYLKVGHQLGEPSPLFAKIELSKVDELKRKFAGGGKQDTMTGATTKNSTATNGVLETIDMETIKNEIDKQAAKVRKLKSSGVDKTVWQPEVAILLQLKKKLL